MPTIYNKVVLDGTTLMDISDTTAIASDVASGKYFYTANGTKTLGTGSGSSSPTLVTKEITSNGTYTASSDSADGYSSVTVNVPSSGITPTGSISITTNGTHDVTNYASAVVNVSGGGSTPSATKHTIHFDFSDGTTASVIGYWDNIFISDAIRATKPTTYNNKTVERALLDGTAWYIKPSETWETLLDGNVDWIHSDDGNYPYCWISSLSSTPITVGSVFRVTYDNTEYRCTAKTTSFNGQTFIVFGNPIWGGGADDGSDEPFVFNDYTRYGAWSGGLNVPNVNSSYYFKIERLVTS